MTETQFYKRWIKALRSGKYKQGREVLLKKEEERNYCCLGVAGIVCGIPERTLLNKQLLDKPDLRKHFSKIPISLRSSPKLQQSLAGMNDTKKSFKQIALYIEKHYKKWIAEAGR